MKRHWAVALGMMWGFAISYFFLWLLPDAALLAIGMLFFVPLVGALVVEREQEQY